MVASNNRIPPRDDARLAVAPLGPQLPETQMVTFAARQGAGKPICRLVKETNPIG
jgi:hypothetical protein